MNASPAPSSRPTPPTLYVDLDGALLRTALRWEALLAGWRRRPGLLLRLPGWLVAGRDRFTADVTARSEPCVERLPWREPALAFLREQKAVGTRLVLVSPAEAGLVRRVADHLGLFDQTLRHEPGRPAQPDGAESFAWMGDADSSAGPLPDAADRWHVVGATARQRRRLDRSGRSIVHHDPAAPIGPALLRLLRPHQWSKNALILAPILLAHRYQNPGALISVGWMIAAFSLVASSVYVLNDLADLDADRQHERKRDRPLASGAVSAPAGLLAMLICLVAGLAVAGGMLGPIGLGVLLAYLLATLLYTFDLKRRMLLDLFTLAGLYTLRVAAGGVAGDAELSPWLLAFCGFMFLSLAGVKRYVEIAASGSLLDRGRGYVAEDLPMIRTLGVASGAIAALVICLYVSEGDPSELYRTPALLWLAPALVMYWIARAWFLAGRGLVHDDPLVFAATDRTSWLVAAGLFAVVLMARLLDLGG